MATINLNKMSLLELQAHRGEVDAAIKAAKDREIGEAREQMRRIAGERGLDFNELFSPNGRRQQSKYPAPKALYRNPEDPKSKTWTGRGKRPNWLLKAMSQGSKLEDFRVDTH